MTDKKRKHWYRMYAGECPVCGRSADRRERVYGDKPPDKKDRYVFLSWNETYDHCMERGDS